MLTIYNRLAEPVTFEGVEIAGGGSHEIPESQLGQFRDCLALRYAIQECTAAIGDGFDICERGDGLAMLDRGRPGDVVTTLEKNDKDLKAACLRGVTDPSTGIAVVEFTAPGDPSDATAGRYLMGAEAFFKTAHPEDRVLKIEVIDTLGLTGLPAGSVVKRYHDEELPEDNQGWYIGVDQFGPDDTRNASFIEVKPLGGYAFLPASFALRITAKKDPVQKDSIFYVNLLQGKYSP